MGGGVNFRKGAKRKSLGRWTEAAGRAETGLLIIVSELFTYTTTGT